MKKLIAAALAVFAVSHAAGASTGEREFRFKDARLKTIIPRLARISGTLYPFDEGDLCEKFTIETPSRPTREEAEQAFFSALGFHGYTRIPRGKQIIIKQAEFHEYDSPLPRECDSYHSNLKTKVFRFKKAKAQDVVKLFKPAMHYDSDLRAFEKGNFIVATDEGPRIDALAAIAEKADPAVEH